MEATIGGDEELFEPTSRNAAEFSPCIPVIDGLGRIYIADEDCNSDRDEDENVDSRRDQKFPLQQIDLVDRSQLSSEFLELTTEGLQIFSSTESEIKQYGFSNEKRREIVHNKSQQIISRLQNLINSHQADENQHAPHMQTVLSMWWLADIMFFRCFYTAASPTVPRSLEEFHLLQQLREWQNYHTANDFEIARFVRELSTELASATNSDGNSRLLPKLLRLFVQQLVHANIDIAVKLFAVIRQHFHDFFDREKSSADSSVDVDGDAQRLEQLLLDCPFRNWSTWLTHFDADQRSRKFSDWQKQCQYIFHQSKIDNDLLHYCVGLLGGGEKTAFAFDQLEKFLAKNNDRVLGAGAEACNDDEHAIDSLPIFSWHQKFLCLLFYEELLATPYGVAKSFLRFRNQNATASWFTPHFRDDAEQNLTFSSGNPKQILQLIAAIFLRDPKSISERLSAALNDCCLSALHFAQLCRHLPPSAQLIDTASVEKFFEDIMLRYGESLLGYGWVPYKEGNKTSALPNVNESDLTQTTTAAAASSALDRTAGADGEQAVAAVEGLDFVMIAFDYLMLCGARGRACISAFIDHLSPTTHLNRTLPFLHNVRALVERHALPLECSLLHLKLAEACCYAVSLADAAEEQDDSLNETPDPVDTAAAGTADPFTAAVEHAARAAKHYPKLSLRLLKQLRARQSITRTQLALVLHHLCAQMQNFSRLEQHSDPDFALITRALSVMVGMELKYQLNTLNDEQQIDDSSTEQSQRVSVEDANFLIATISRCIRKCRSLVQGTKIINDFLAHFGADAIGPDNFTLYSYRLLETAIAMRSQRGIPPPAALQKLKLFARQKLKELLLAKPELLQPPIPVIDFADGGEDRNRRRKRSRVTLKDVSAVLSEQIESSDIDGDDEVKDIDPMEIDEEDFRPPTNLLKPPLTVVQARKRICNTGRRRARPYVGFDTVDADENDAGTPQPVAAGLKSAHSFRRRRLVDRDEFLQSKNVDDADTSSSSSSLSGSGDIDRNDEEEGQGASKFARTESPAKTLFRSPSVQRRRTITYVEHIQAEEESPSLTTPIDPAVAAADDSFSSSTQPAANERRKSSPTKIRIHTREVVLIPTRQCTQNVYFAQSRGVTDADAASSSITMRQDVEAADEGGSRLPSLAALSSVEMNDAGTSSVFGHI